jgi:hypothetical protein
MAEKKELITQGKVYLVIDGRRYHATEVRCSEPYTEKEKQYIEFHFEGIDLLEGTEFSMNLRLEARHKKEFELYKLDPRQDKTLIIDIDKGDTTFKILYGTSKNPEYLSLIGK